MNKCKWIVPMCFLMLYGSWGCAQYSEKYHFKSDISHKNIIKISSTPEHGWIDNFDKMGEWKSIWKEPQELEVRDGQLRMLSVAKARIGNGSSAVALTTPVIDFDKYRYMVVKVTEIGGTDEGSHQFRMSLYRMESGASVDRVDGIISVFPAAFADPTLVVLDMRNKRLMWRGKGAVTIQIQACFPNSRIAVDFIKFTNALTPEEAKDWKATRSRMLSATPEPFHGLEELAVRQGWLHTPHHLAGRPANALLKENTLQKKRITATKPTFDKGKSYLSERLIYRDSVTGQPVWRMTNYPYMDSKFYMNHMHWNANGSIMRWLTWRGGARQWFMDSNGNNLRSWRTGIPGLTKKNNMRSFSWHEQDPACFFTTEIDGLQVTIYKVNINTSKKKVATTFKMKKKKPGIIKVHPDGKHFFIVEMLTSNVIDDAKGRVYIVGPEGIKHTFILNHNIQDKSQFTGNPNLDVYITCTRPRSKRGGYVMSADGSKSTRLFRMGAGHDDWTGNGEWLISYKQNNIIAMRPDKSEEKILCDLRTGGHLGCALDDRSVLSDAFHNGPWSDSIIYMDVSTATAHKVCMASSSYTGHSRKHWYHPYIHTNHPHASMSPDGTKGLYQSDYMSTYSNIYVVPTRLPDRPENAQIKGRSLRWQPGERHREIKGYFIYHAKKSGGPYQQLNAEPLTDTSLTLQDNGGFYVVTAVEYSGLESMPTLEICATAKWTGRVRQLTEAELCNLDNNLRLWLGDGTAVGMYGVGLRKGIKKGIIELQANVPRKGDYYLLARMRRHGFIAMNDGTTIAFTTENKQNSNQWRWEKIGSLPLSEKKQNIKISLEGNIQVDQFMLTDEADYKPKGAIVLDSVEPAPPVALQAEVLDPFTVRLNWKKSKSMDTSYYNVYCGLTASYAIVQARRIGSPAELAFLDWGLKPGTEYHYRVVAVDRAGNESAPAEIKVSTPPTKLFTLLIEAESGTLEAPAKVVEAKVAENGKGVLLPTGEKHGELTITFDVPVDGEYAIWSHIYQYAGGGNPLLVNIDDEYKMPWRVRIPEQRWGWDFVGGKGPLKPKRWNYPHGHVAANPMLLQLKKGKHAITVSGATGRIIDCFVVTNDPTWKKTGFNSLSSH